MKKFLSYIVLLSLLSLNNLTFVFAWNTDPLQAEKQNSITILDSIENKLDQTLSSIEWKTKSEELKEQINEKQAEIEQYIELKQAEIKSESSKADIKDIIEETSKVVTLKAVAWITATTDVTETLADQIDISKKDMLKAENTLIDSLQNGDDYVLMLKSKLSKENILSTLKKFDENISLNDMFEEDEYHYFELTIKENSLLKQELLENIDSGEVPNNFLWIEVVKPELLKISDINIWWEETDKLWWIKKYGVSKYQDILKNQTEKNGKKIKVWIVDTWISYNHPDLKNQISKTIAWYDFVNDDNDPLDDQGHGTHVSGTIASEINGAWIFGVNPNVELVGLKICDSSWFCPTYWVLKALEYAKENKLDILNMSLGAKGNIATSPVCLAIKDITDAGTIVVAAAGNSNIDTSRFVPGWCSESLTVWAVDENNTRATFSNYGEKVDVAAPWVWIYSTYLHDGYKSLNGTSMATPHIVGIVSILKTFKPELTTNEIKAILKSNTLPVQTENNKKIASQVDLEKILTGFGIINSQKVENQLPEIQKETEEIPKENQPEMITQTGSEKQSEPSSVENSQETFILEDNALIDESVGLVIQNPEEETTKINSAESEQQEIVSEENSESSSQINGINLNGEDSQTDQIEINNIEEETIQEVLEENSSEESEESDITGIQNSYTCSFNIWGSCYLSLTNANNTSIYSYSAWASGLSYSTSSSKVTIYGNKAGTINFYVNKYNTSKRKYELLHTIVITVTDPVKTLKATMGTTTFQKNESTSINVTSGNGGYSVTSSNTSVAQISGSNTSWTVKWVWIGNATITIKDSKWKSGTWNITVTPRNLTLSTYSLDVDKWVNGIINITDGNGWYTLIKKNNDISVNLSGTRITVYSNVAGTHTLQVRDSAGKVVSLSVRVKQKYNINLWVIYDIKSTSNKWVWWLKFKVSWNSMWLISEVWVQFQNGYGSIEKQVLKTQKDGEYMVAYSTESCRNCTNFKPYYTIWWATNIANVNEIWKEEESNYNEEEYVYEWEADIQKENDSDWEVEIASASYGADFSWMIYILWFWKSLFSFKQKVVDIKDKYGEASSILISLIPLVWEWYDILTLLWMKDPITGEKLTKLTVWLTLVWLLSWAGSWGAARKVWEEALNKIAKDLGLWVDEVIRIATNYFNWLDFSTVDGLINNAKYFKIDNFTNSIKKEASIVVKLKNVKWSTVPKPDLSKIKSDKLKNRIIENYRDWATIWNWSTADAIRYEKATWEYVWGKSHIIKWDIEKNAFVNLIESWTLWDSDKNIAIKILQDLTNALNEK